MRIAFVSDSVYPWNVGGLETIERAEAEALSKEHELHYFSLRWPGMRSEFTKGGISYHSFHDVDRSRFYRHGRRSIREAIVFTVGMFRIFRYRFDVIHSNEFPILQLPVLKLYCILTGCKLIVYVHEVWDSKYWTTYLGGFMGHLANAYANLALRMADHYVANSDLTAERLGGLGIKGRRVTIFAPTIDDATIASVKAGKGRKEIIFAGRLIKEKRLDKWLDVFSKTARQTSASGVIVGEGPDRRRIESLIRRMKLQKKVEVRDFYSEGRKAELFRRIKEAGLLLHMSEREGLAVVALESIALGTPVLLPSYTPIPNDVKEMCIVVDEENLPSTAAKILRGRKEDYLPNRSNIRRFYTSNIRAVYRGIFRSLGIERHE
ncbi:MAG: glycosyltransferase [Candidatus Micrarchaeota archaeon]|nr:glycosyltransferase [Candidatus Micrarchaeota archaeon]